MTGMTVMWMPSTNQIEPIPSGRVPGRWGLYIAVLWSVLSLMLASYLGEWALAATVLGLFLAWAYSAPTSEAEA